MNDIFSCVLGKKFYQGKLKFKILLVQKVLEMWKIKNELCLFCIVLYFFLVVK